MMPLLNNSKLDGLSAYLLSQGYIDEKIVQISLKESFKKKISFITYLRQLKYIDDSKLAEATASYYGLPFFDLDNYDFNLLPRNVLSTELIQKYFILPLFIRENQLILGAIDPSLPNLHEINFLTGLTTELVVVEAAKLTKIIDLIYSDELLTDLQLEEKALEASMANDANEKIENYLTQIESNKSPIVKSLDKILLDAISKQASDIHFEPYEKYCRIRFRIDGILYEMNPQSLRIANFLTARLKVMANLDISERRIPQDGCFKINLSMDRSVNFRLNTCPTLYGEKAVVRILESFHQGIDLNNLGMNESQRNTVIDALKSAQGIILVTGPTGSGKTATLYCALDRLNTTEVNISSVEDPIEIQLFGINQVQINLKTGLTFSSALRAFLRQDPDIIMVGEIRDLETAEIAVRAAQTGHLILSTLHTNSATETLVRLSNIGIPPFNIASSIILIIAQRLIRRLCNHCKEETFIPRRILLNEGFYPEELIHLVNYKARGCEHCYHGYKGRIGVYEILPISDEMTRLIIKNKSALQLKEQARLENTQDLRRSALEKVKERITSLEEINRVIKK
jgi:type IV pilus assembly protein PilB